jgi:predicted nucleic acid-binding protein
MTFIDTAIDSIPNISVITQIELLCWNTSETTTQSIKNFISDSVVLDINNDVIAECVRIRKSKKIKTPDAIIAATALSYDLILITRNIKDFSNINGLIVIDPFSL